MKRYSFIVYFCAIFITMSNSFAAPNPWRLERPGLNSTLYKFDSYTTYDQYVTAYRQALSKLSSRRPELTPAQIEEMIPLTYKNNSNCRQVNGLLLIHGASDSPYILSDIFNFFKSKKCIVMKSLILPGHGLTPGALREVTSDDWIAATEFALKDLKREGAQNIYAIGYSTGGSLILNQLLKGNTDIKKVVLLTPAIDLLLTAEERSQLNKLYQQSIFDTKVAYSEVHADEDPFKYESFPFSGAYFVKDLVEANNKLLPDFKGKFPPISIYFSEEDVTVNSEATKNFIKHKAISTVEGAMYSATKKDGAFYKNVKIVNSYNLLKKVVGLSHLGIPISTKNLIYGENATKNYGCLHYDKPELIQLFQSCQRHDNNFVHGEITPDNIKKYTALCRIRFNPYFNQMIKEINLFVSQEATKK